MASAHHIVGNTIVLSPGHAVRGSVDPIAACGVIVRGNTVIGQPSVKCDHARDTAEAE